MAVKWDKKSVIAAFQEALSPQRAVPSALPNLAGAIKKIIELNKVIKT